MMHPWHQQLLQTGHQLSAQLDPLVSAADPLARVSRRSRHLCAALGALSASCLEALSAAPIHPALRAQVAEAGALLSLLTKIDDQVIDSLEFHGGWRTERGVLRARTRAWLQPTLRSIVAAAPAADAPRCHLAAELGGRLRALAADPQRLDHLLAIIARGWQIQVEAVARLSAHPATVSGAQVREVTGWISGAWLLMITAIGALPAAVPQPLTASEEAAFYAWGGWIQRADALADLPKDAADGLISSLPGWMLWSEDPASYLEAVTHQPDQLYAMLARSGVDRACLPPPGALAALEARLARLGSVPSLLRWIHRFLSWRYRTDPRCQSAALRGQEHASTPPSSFAIYLQGASCLAP